MAAMAPLLWRVCEAEGVDFIMSDSSTCSVGEEGLHVGVHSDVRVATYLGEMSMAFKKHISFQETFEM